jgi:predicted ABC-type ATPase
LNNPKTNFTVRQSSARDKDMKPAADEILKESGGDWKSLADIFKAGKRAVSLLNSYIEKGASFNQETTLCGNKE